MNKETNISPTYDPKLIEQIEEATKDALVTLSNSLDQYDHVWTKEERKVVNKAMRLLPR